MMNEYKETLNRVNNMQQTENGALGYSTSGEKLVDLNFVVPSNHNNVSSESFNKFKASLGEDLVNTVKWMFYLRDVREGLGERDSFVDLYMTLYNTYPEAALKVLPLIPVYGRWKDVIDILSKTLDNTPLADAIYTMLKNQLAEDAENWAQGKSISLLAKWLPSVNASQKSRSKAARIARHLGLIFADYRKLLANLRKYIDVTEVKTCGGEWDKVDYNKVSSNANARYVKAFMRHDPVRRQKYLNDLAKPATGAVMHATNLYPYEVYVKYNLYGRPRTKNWDPLAVPDEGVEALWNNLKDVESIGNTMVVCDGSGSMESTIRGANGIRAIDVSRSLGVYFSERTSGEYKDKVIEFSSYPQYIDLSGCKTLADKYNIMTDHDDCSNTDLERVFNLLLKTAVDNNLPQDELPNSILVISDMEFDKAGQYTTAYDGSGYDLVMAQYKTLFDVIKNRWNNAGYTMPKIVFWNVNSRTNTVPVTANEAGVILVSGFSVNNIKMVMSGKLDPWEALKSVLDSKRYDAVEDALMG